LWDESIQSDWETQIITVRGKQIKRKGRKGYERRAKALITEVKVRSVGELWEKRIPRMTVFSIVFAGRDLLL
jgi:hypothetical protein